jgi:hypothetical protein
MPSESNLESNLEINNLSQNQQDQGLIKDKYESIFREIQGIISVFYILAVAIGMLFNYQKYSEFGINIFDYADIFEFLVAPFSDVIILLFTVGSSLLVYLIYRADIFTEKKFTTTYSRLVFHLNKKLYYNYYRYFSFVFLFFIYLHISADFYGQLTARKIKEQTPISIRFVDDEIKEGIIIGNTKQVIFLLEGEKVKAIPFTTLVKEFEIKK